MPKSKKKEPQNVVSIDGSEYEFDALADEAKLAINHLAQLDRDIATLQMKFAQLDAAKSVFLSRLKEALPE
jgi:PHD/YefM family antitoxin component YafN of YafNO toxin-antitoxin module